MKKVLFTLAALCAFGIASAEVAPEMGFRSDVDNEVITEVTMNPGESLQIKVSIESMVMPMVSGMQAQWRMFDAEHNPINYDVTNKVAPGKVYGSRVKTWFEGIEAGSSDPDVGGFDGLGISTAMPYENVYRIMATNTKYNMCFFRWADNEETVENCPMNIGHFTLVASADWDEEFATMELDLDYTLWNQCPGYDPQVFEEVFNTNPLILKIKNGAAVTPPTPDPIPLAGEIVIGDPDEDGFVTIEYTGEEEGVTIVAMIDGVAVEIIDGKVALGAYGEHTVSVEVSGEGYITLTDEKTVNWVEPVTPPEPTEKTAEPTFNGYTTDGIHAYFVEIIPTEPSVIYYRVQYPDGTWTEWAEYEEILSFTGDGRYRVEAYAVADGKLPSFDIAYEFVVSPLTGIAEMNADKAISSVRYFNMAGQEMSEANGLTIVVTTYTDGTTSTAKVMK